MSEVGFRVKLTSKRTGRVGWIRPDGTPTDHESEAGCFTRDRAEFWISDIETFYTRTVGRCAYKFEVLS